MLIGLSFRALTAAALSPDRPVSHSDFLITEQSCTLMAVVVGSNGSNNDSNNAPG